LAKEKPEEHSDDRHHQRPAGELRKRKLPTHQHLRMMLSSATRLVDASSNAMGAVKLAPLRKIDLAKATAA